ncbi:hypothetical protein ACFE04_013585 [Oxalis oulophora]
MSFGRKNHHQHHPQGSKHHANRRPSHRHSSSHRNSSSQRSPVRKNYYNKNYNNWDNSSVDLRQHDGSNNNNYYYVHSNGASSLKRRKFSASTWGEGSRACLPSNTDDYRRQLAYNNSPPPMERLTADNFTSKKRGRSEEDELVFVSRDEIDKCSASRKHGIDALRETYLRFSYCGFIQNAGLRLQLPQTTIGTAMVLCHRFFLRRSHAHHDCFLIATAALFLAAKSEETARPMHNLLVTTSEVFYQQNFDSLAYMLPVGWFQQIQERMLQAEQLILTTLNFELTVEHPYGPLTTALGKLGLSHTPLVQLALNLVSEGLRSSLWLQFKPNHIAAGAAYVAAKFLNMDLSHYQNMWKEFQTTPGILQGTCVATTNGAFVRGKKEIGNGMRRFLHDCGKVDEKIVVDVE